MTRKLQFRNHCIFCGGTGMSKEHVWADWLKAYIPRTMPNYGVGKNVFTPAAPPVSSVKRVQGDPHAKRIRRVCKKCNVGWMSRVQENVKPYIVAMMTGKKMTLHRKAQTLISTWIAMAVMVGAFEDPDTVAISQADRTYLNENQKPPPHWRIWIASYKRDKWKTHWQHNVLFLTEEDPSSIQQDRPPPPNAHLTTWVVGGVLTHCISSSLKGGIAPKWTFGPKVGRLITRIWTPRESSISWPPSRALSDADADAVANGIYRVIMRKTGVISSV